jgi:opacity protein-like surface antigen
MLATPLILLASAAPSTSPFSLVDAAGVPAAEAPPTEALVVFDAATEESIDLATDSQTSQVPAGPQGPAAPPPRPRERLTFKGGYYDSSEDGFDDGFNFVASWIRPISEILSSEVELGYLDAEGSEGLVDRDVWAITFLANARVGVPLGERFEIYGGIGLGTFYYDAEASAPGIDVSADGFLFAGDAYFGANVKLGEKLRLGVEWKYYATDSESELDGGLDANVVMLTLGFDR